MTLQRTGTGVRRLDDLLDGGIPRGNAALVYGPPFIGKDVLARLFLFEGWRSGEAGIMVLTGDAANDVRAQLTEMDPAFPGYEAQGLVHFVDTYSKSIAADDELPDAEYVDGPVNLNGISLAVNNAQRKAIAHGEKHRLVIDSLSTLITYTNAQTTFRFLQVLVGKARRAGATTLLMLEQGMHTDAEVQTFKHLADGIIELKPEGTETQLRVMGLGTVEHRGWVEYRYSPHTLDVVGSFAAGRIR